ncbi:MAG TPA: CAP domain-containing protein [Deinococcales bacterium]|nr:CAP domain-containing protein [Deinococcales bacterium]
MNAARANPRYCGDTHYPAAKPLTLEGRLSAAAQAHSDDMAARNYFAHKSPDGTNAAQRVTTQGYRWSHVGENLAAGQANAEQAVAGWLASPGHCANLMRAEFTTTGLGFAAGRPGAEYATYWTQVFARPQ